MLLDVSSYWEIEYAKQTSLEEALANSTSYKITDSYQHYCQATVVLCFVRLLKIRAGKQRKHPGHKFCKVQTCAIEAGRVLAGGMPLQSGQTK